MIQSDVLDAATAVPRLRDVAIGIMAYNEERNIRSLIESIQRQSSAARISRIVVVASGCTDGTCDVVRSMMPDDERIVLVAEGERAGKIAAINTFLADSNEPIIVVSCGDLIMEADTLERLIAPFDDPGIGMVGAHPVPINDESTFVGFAVQLMWGLHDRVARRRPKMGELFACRNLLHALDTRALCDELSVEHQIREAGLRVVYGEGARVRNQGPQTLADFVKQRVRWIAANLQVIDDYGIHVSTMAAGNVAGAALEHLRERRPRLDWFVAVAFIEAYCRLRAWLDYHVVRSREKHRVWDPVATTKDLGA